MIQDNAENHKSRESAPKKHCFKLGELLDADFPPRDYLWYPYLLRVGLGLVAGCPDSGKSMFCRELAMRLSSGESTFAGSSLRPHHNRAIYVTTEDPKEDTKFVLERQFKGLGERSAILDRMETIFADTLSTEEILTELNASLAKEPADLVVIDSFGDVFNGRDLNSNSEVRAALKSWAMVVSEHRCAVIFVTHVNKIAYKLGMDQAHIQGASALAQKVRVAFGWQAEPDSDLRYFGVLKGNGLSRTLKSNALELIFKEDTFLYEATGKVLSLAELAKRATGTASIDVEWELIFGEETSLTTAVLVEKIMEDYDVSERTAKSKLKALQKSKRGVYFKPGYFPAPDDMPTEPPKRKR